MAKEIPLTQGQVAIVDDEEFERVNQYKWCAAKRQQKDVKYYAYRKSPRENGKHPNLLMHRFILDYDGNLQVDHINGNSLDNRKENLRIVTNAQNQHNQKVVYGAVPYKGVCFNKRRGLYMGRLRYHGSEKYLGYFKNPEEAARAYDRAATELYGEFAATNDSLGLLKNEQD